MKTINLLTTSLFVLAFVFGAGAFAAEPQSNPPQQTQQSQQAVQQDTTAVTTTDCCYTPTYAASDCCYDPCCPPVYYRYSCWRGGYVPRYRYYSPYAYPYYGYPSYRPFLW